jgi:SOS-response transcriptional repressor LexA
VSSEGGRRAAVLEFVRRYCAENGHGPSVRDVASGVGLESTSSTANHIRKLRLGGYLAGGERPNTLHPVPKPGCCAACGSSVLSEHEAVPAP